MIYQCQHCGAQTPKKPDDYCPRCAVDTFRSWKFWEIEESTEPDIMRRRTGEPALIAMIDGGVGEIDVREPQTEETK
jgi:hypothetical protein